MTAFITVVAIVTIVGLLLLIPGARRGKDVSGWATAIIALDALILTTYFSSQGQASAERSENLVSTQVAAETGPALILSCPPTNKVFLPEDSVLEINPDSITSGNSYSKVPPPREYVQCEVQNFGRLPALNATITFSYAWFPNRDLAGMMLWSMAHKTVPFKYSKVRILGIASGGHYVIWIINRSCDTRERADESASVNVPTEITYSTPVQPGPTTVPLVSETTALSKVSLSLESPDSIGPYPNHCRPLPAGPHK